MRKSIIPIRNPLIYKQSVYNIALKLHLYSTQEYESFPYENFLLLLKAHFASRSVSRIAKKCLGIVKKGEKKGKKAYTLNYQPSPLERLHKKEKWRICRSIIAGKTVWEIGTGSVLVSSLHLYAVSSGLLLFPEPAGSSEAPALPCLSRLFPAAQERSQSFPTRLNAQPGTGPHANSGSVFFASPLFHTNDHSSLLLFILLNVSSGNDDVLFSSSS